MKSKYQLILFDLDGTLTDSGPGVTDCVRRALARENRPIPPADTLRKFIGPPLFASFTKLCGMTAQEAEQAVQDYRGFYNTEGVYNNSVYPGIPEVLHSLQEAGAKLAVATSKPASMARVVLDHFDLLSCFDCISAADESDKSGGKEALIRPVLEKAHCAPSDALMIGDTKFDTAGARKAGVHFLGVLYGFGTEEEMRGEGASLFARTPTEIVDLLIDK